MNLEMGFMAKDFISQLLKNGVVLNEKQQNKIIELDKDNQSVGRLYVRGYISDNMMQKIREKITKSIQEIINNRKNL